EVERGQGSAGGRSLEGRGAHRGLPRRARPVGRELRGASGRARRGRRAQRRGQDHAPEGRHGFDGAGGGTRAGLRQAFREGPPVGRLRPAE
ncbi:MAG: hypothetical protein AVDCRST_MAG03-2386, partial [uncultured Rubrobacteraceae bacterium]